MSSLFWVTVPLRGGGCFSNSIQHLRGMVNCICLISIGHPAGFHFYQEPVSIPLLNIADDALIDVENLRVAGGEQQENAPLDQRNDLLRRFCTGSCRGKRNDGGI